MPTATLTSKGQITLPRAIRDRLHVTTGDQVDFVVNQDGDIVVRPVSLDVTELRGLLRRPRKRPVSIAAMNAAIVRQHSKKR